MILVIHGRGVAQIMAAGYACIITRSAEDNLTNTIHFRSDITSHGGKVQIQSSGKTHKFY